MPEVVQIILLALLPAAGNFAGGLLAEAVKTTRANLSLALHAAAGIVLGVIAMELAPRVFEGLPAWLAGIAFFAGGGAYLLLDAVVEKLTSRSEAAADVQNVRATTRSAGAWMIMPPFLWTCSATDSSLARDRRYPSSWLCCWQSAR